MIYKIEVGGFICSMMIQWKITKQDQYKRTRGNISLLSARQETSGEEYCLILCNLREDNRSRADQLDGDTENISEYNDDGDGCGVVEVVVMMRYGSG